MPLKRVDLSIVRLLRFLKTKLKKPIFRRWDALEVSLLVFSLRAKSHIRSFVYYCKLTKPSPDELVRDYILALNGVNI